MFMSSVGFSCQNWFKPFPSLVPFGKLLKPFPVFPSKDSPFPLHFPVFFWLFNFIFGKEQGEQIEISSPSFRNEISPNPCITKILITQLSWPPKKTNLSLGSTSPQDQDSIVSITEVQDQFHPLTFGAPGQGLGFWRGDVGFVAVVSNNIFGIVKIWGSNMASSNVIDLHLLSQFFSLEQKHMSHQFSFRNNPMMMYLMPFLRIP